MYSKDQKLDDEGCGGPGCTAGRCVSGELSFTY